MCVVNNGKGIKKLRALLEEFADANHYLFSLDDLSPTFGELSRPALKVLLQRAVSDELLVPLCRSLYLYPKTATPKGLVLYHAAAKLRAGTFNYISLESALSDAGIISQVPLQWLTLMSGGRSSVIPCGRFGTIEYVHTAATPTELATEVVYDSRCRLWRATASRAIRDMRRCRRPLDLIDWSLVHESS